MAAGNLKVVTVNTVDQVGILYPRDAYHRRAKIGSAYLEVRMGMFFTFVPSGNDDAHCVAETIAPAGYLDWFTFGLKDSSANAPGKAGAQFIGHCWSADAVPANTNALTANTAGQASMANGGGKQLLATLNGATVISSGDSSVIMYFPVWSATNVNAFAFDDQGFAFLIDGQKVQLTADLANTGLYVLTTPTATVLLKKGNTNVMFQSFSNVTEVPAPAPLALLGVGLVGIGMIRRRRVAALQTDRSPVNLASAS